VDELELYDLVSEEYVGSGHGEGEVRLDDKECECKFNRLISLKLRRQGIVLSSSCTTSPLPY